MEKITDKIKALPSDAAYFSLEFFPPKTHIVMPTIYLLRNRRAKASRGLQTSKPAWNACQTPYARCS